MTLKTLIKLLAFTLLFLLTACGADDTSDPTKLSPQAHKVTVTIGLNGSAATTIGSVDLDVLLPAGFVLETDSSGQPTASALTFLVAGAMSEVNYVGSTGAINAKIIKTDGFPGDADLMRISRVYPADATLPTDTSFSVTVVAYDVGDPQNPTVISGLAERITVSTELAE